MAIVRVIGKDMGLGNQIQFIPVINALHKNKINVVSDSPIYYELGIITGDKIPTRIKCTNLTVFGYDWKRVLRTRIKFSGKLIGFKYTVKSKEYGFGYNYSLRFDRDKSELINNMRLLDFLDLDEKPIDFSIKKTKNPQKNWIALGISEKDGKNFPFWEDLAETLKSEGQIVHAFGDYQIKNAINPPTPTLSDLRDWLSQMEYYIGVDSGIMHMADALKIPMVVIFGATHIGKNRPYHQPNIILKPTIYCAPCYGIWGEVDCFQNPKFQCMSYSSEQVHEAFLKLNRLVKVVK